MLDTIFKTGSDRKQAHDDLRTLVEQAREERTAMELMLAQVNSAAPTLARTNRTLDELRIKADEVTRRSDKLGKVMGSYEECAKNFEQLESRMNALLAQVADARGVAEAMAAPDGGLQQMRQAADDLAARSRDAQATLDELQREGEDLEALRERLRQASADMGQSVGSAVALKSELDALRKAQGELTQEMHGIRKGASDAHDDAESARSAVTDVQ